MYAVSVASDAFTVWPSRACGLTVTLSFSPAVIVYWRMSGSQPSIVFPLTRIDSSAAPGLSVLRAGLANDWVIVYARSRVFPSSMAMVIVPVRIRCPLSPSVVLPGVTVTSLPAA